MKLSELLKPLLDELSLSSDPILLGLQNDSRQILQGDLFIAYPGVTTDGRQYIKAAMDAGAVAVCYEPEKYAPDLSFSSTIPMIPVPQLETKLATIASQFYGEPSKKLCITGVTGTNGKTTIAYQLAQAYGLLGKRAAYIGTLGQGDVHALKPLSITTPDALCVQKLLHTYLSNGIEYVCMEVSSHALELQRVDCVAFNQAIFTNLTLDHLDFHGTMEAYAAAKASLFAKESLEWAIINQDSPYLNLMQEQLMPTCQRLSYGLGEGSSVRARSWETGLLGTSMEVDSPWGKHSLRLRSLGKFNLYNSLAVFASLVASKVAPVDEISAIMGELTPSPGRMEIVSENPSVIVDYAHTPDALENVLQTLGALKPTKLWVVFGCGGDRDRTKRSIMGRIASQYADNVILTNDNPRSEDPETIANEVLTGISRTTGTTVILDRRLAIEFALNQAGEHDIVLIAGKGHEDYQIIGHQKQVFSDQAVVRAYFHK